MPTRTLVKSGRVVTMDPAVPDLDRGDVLIEDGRIAADRRQPRRRQRRDRSTRPA